MTAAGPAAAPAIYLWLVAALIGLTSRAATRTSMTSMRKRASRGVMPWSLRIAAVAMQAAATMPLPAGKVLVNACLHFSRRATESPRGAPSMPAAPVPGNDGANHTPADIDQKASITVHEPKSPILPSETATRRSTTAYRS